MSVAVIADAHIGGPGGEAAPLVAQLDALAGSGCRRLLLMGDLFHVWVGDAKYETPAIRSVAESLARLRRAGLQIDYIEGNRDFFIAGSAYSALFAGVGSEVVLEVAGRRYLAVHGDGLNDRDRLYLFWRWLSKSRVSRFLMLRLPRAAARRAVLGMERRLARTNFKHKSSLPEAAIRRYAERRLGEGYDALLLGHFHRPRRWRVAGGEVLLVDAWFNSRRVEWLGRGRDGDLGR